MPIVRIDYDSSKVGNDQMAAIVEQIQKLVAEATGYEPKDISVFASANQITANAAPLEIYVHATFPTATPEAMESMLEKLASKIVELKQEHGIAVPFNLSVVKMDWKFKLEV